MGNLLVSRLADATGAADAAGWRGRPRGAARPWNRAGGIVTGRRRGRQSGPASRQRFVSVSLVEQSLLLQQCQQVVLRPHRPQLLPPPQLPIVPLQSRRSPMRHLPCRQMTQSFGQRFLTPVTPNAVPAAALRITFNSVRQLRVRVHNPSGSSVPYGRQLRCRQRRLPHPLADRTLDAAHPLSGAGVTQSLRRQAERHHGFLENRWWRISSPSSVMPPAMRRHWPQRNAGICRRTSP